MITLPRPKNTIGITAPSTGSHRGGTILTTRSNSRAPASSCRYVRNFVPDINPQHNHVLITTIYVPSVHRSYISPPTSSGIQHRFGPALRPHLVRRQTPSAPPHPPRPPAPHPQCDAPHPQCLRPPGTVPPRSPRAPPSHRIAPPTRTSTSAAWLWASRPPHEPVSAA